MSCSILSRSFVILSVSLDETKLFAASSIVRTCWHVLCLTTTQVSHTQSCLSNLEAMYKSEKEKTESFWEILYQKLNVTEKFQKDTLLKMYQEILIFSSILFTISSTLLEILYRRVQSQHVVEICLSKCLWCSSCFWSFFVWYIIYFTIMYWIQT
jgi:hypothetical protein